MAYRTIWYNTDLPEEVINFIVNDLNKNFKDFTTSVVGNATEAEINENIRKSKNIWIPTTYWIGGFIWNYISLANRENYQYDLTHIDNEIIQYTKYTVGDFYSWHQDSQPTEFYKPKYIPNEPIHDFLNLKTECVRKLSFVLQLSEHDEYEGGNLQLMDENGMCYFAPRKRGTLILFDSRTNHRVLKVTKGERKSLVGWVMGPRWK
jgi:PKHD-type hydroxylase